MVRTLRSYRGRIVLLIAVAAGALALAAKADRLSHKEADISAASLRQIQEASILYALHFEDESGWHKPWVYCVSAKGYGTDAALERRMKRDGVRRVDESWLRQSARPERFFYVEVRDIKRLSPGRVKVGAYLCLDYDSPILTEAVATIDLKYVHNRWTVDEASSNVRTGD